MYKFPLNIIIFISDVCPTVRWLTHIPYQSNFMNLCCCLVVYWEYCSVQSNVTTTEVSLYYSLLEVSLMSAFKKYSSYNCFCTLITYPNLSHSLICADFILAVKFRNRKLTFQLVYIMYINEGVNVMLLDETLTCASCRSNIHPKYYRYVTSKSETVWSICT